jgi:hypothetical protein
MSETLPPLPEPHGWIYDGIPNMLLFNRGPLPQATALACSTAPVYSADQMRSYAAAALAATVKDSLTVRCPRCWETMLIPEREPLTDEQIDALYSASYRTRESDYATNLGSMCTW